MIVASLDPVGDTVSIVSIPRDLVNVPLGDGDVFGPKLNSLMSYADRHPEDFPNGGMRALQDAIGALLGIQIHYYAQVDFGGFIAMVDAVGGVDVNVKKGFEDPNYDGYGFDQRGFSINAGQHHLNGIEALAYARVRKAGRERLHPRRPAAGDPRRAAQTATIAAAACSGSCRICSTPSATRSGPTSRSTAAGPRGHRRRGRPRRRWSGRSSSTRW